MGHLVGDALRTTEETAGMHGLEIKKEEVVHWEWDRIKGYTSDCCRVVEARGRKRVESLASSDQQVASLFARVPKMQPLCACFMDPTTRESLVASVGEEYSYLYLLREMLRGPLFLRGCEPFDGEKKNCVRYVVSRD